MSLSDIENLEKQHADRYTIIYEGITDQMMHEQALREAQEKKAKAVDGGLGRTFV